MRCRMKREDMDGWRMAVSISLVRSLRSYSYFIVKMQFLRAKCTRTVPHIASPPPIQPEKNRDARIYLRVHL